MKHLRRPSSREYSLRRASLLFEWAHEARGSWPADRLRAEGLGVKTKTEFERQVLPHLPAAYSLARWILRQRQDAEDAVQESLLRAFRGYGRFAGSDPRAWLLAIVRNTCLTAANRRRTDAKIIVLRDVLEERTGQRVHLDADPAPPPDAGLELEEERRQVHAAIAALPLAFREVLVLREFHDLDYRQIATVVGVPVGTVMSRLARARTRLKALLDPAGDRTGTSK